MNIQKLENEILHLPLAARTHLAQKLILSLDTLSGTEIQEEWLLESKRRATEIDSGDPSPIPATEVMQKAKKIAR